MSRTLRIADEDALRQLLARTRGISRSIGGTGPSGGASPVSAAAHADRGETALPVSRPSERPAKKPRATQTSSPMKISEDDLQICCFEWIEVIRPQHPILRYVVHVPNGGKRPRGAAGKLKAMGVKKGVLDILLALPNNGWAGLAIELKVGNNKPTEGQREWLSVFDAAGYYTAVCYDFESFQAHVMRFLAGDAATPGCTSARLNKFLESRRSL